MLILVYYQVNYWYSIVNYLFWYNGTLSVDYQNTIDTLRFRITTLSVLIWVHYRYWFRYIIGTLSRVHHWFWYRYTIGTSIGIDIGTANYQYTFVYIIGTLSCNHIWVHYRRWHIGTLSIHYRYPIGADIRYNIALHSSEHYQSVCVCAHYWVH